MKKLFFVITFALSIYSQFAPLAALAVSPSTTLQCKTLDEIETVDLVVDLDNRKMNWGTTEYLITKISDNYITGSQDMGSHRDGGEIWVMDDSSGEYWRASVEKICTDKNCTSEKNDANFYKGICQKKLF